MNLKQLQEAAYANAKAKGFRDNPRTVAEENMLIRSELAEAFEAYRDGDVLFILRDGKPEGILVELADVVIRCAETAEHHGMDLSKPVPCEPAPYGLVEILEAANNCLAHDHISEHALVCIVRLMFSAADQWANSIGLWTAIEIKMDYNATRPRMHGGKRL